MAMGQRPCGPASTHTCFGRALYVSREVDVQRSPGTPAGAFSSLFSRAHFPSSSGNLAMRPGLFSYRGPGRNVFVISVQEMPTSTLTPETLQILGHARKSLRTLFRHKVRDVALARTG